MKVYALSQYLSPKAKRAMVTAQYDHKSNGVRITEDDRCPLAVGIPDCYDQPSAPDGFTVALMLLRDTDTGPENPEAWLDTVSHAAQEFIDDWDSGRITPESLPTALGLKVW